MKLNRKSLLALGSVAAVVLVVMRKKRKAQSENDDVLARWLDAQAAKDTQTAEQFVDWLKSTENVEVQDILEAYDLDDAFTYEQFLDTVSADDRTKLSRIYVRSQSGVRQKLALASLLGGLSARSRRRASVRTQD